MMIRELFAEQMDVARVRIHVLAQQVSLVALERGLENIPEFRFGKGAAVAEMENVEPVPMLHHFAAAVADRDQDRLPVLEVFLPQQVGME